MEGGKGWQWVVGWRGGGFLMRKSPDESNPMKYNNILPGQFIGKKEDDHLAVTSLHLSLFFSFDFIYLSFHLFPAKHNRINQISRIKPDGEGGREEGRERQKWR